MTISLVAAKEVDKNLELKLSGTAADYFNLFENAEEGVFAGVLWGLIEGNAVAAGLDETAWLALIEAVHDSGDGVFNVTLTVPRN